MDDIERAFNAITAKRIPFTGLFEYYDGLQPLRYSAKRLQDAFKDLNVYFAENWCGVVVDSVTDRLTFTGWNTKNTQAQKDLTNIFEDLLLAQDSDDINISAGVTGEAFLIVWKDTADGDIDAYYNDPRLCHVFYKGDKPKEKEFAAKMWVDESDSKPRINLYYTDRIEHWESNKKDPQSGKAFRKTGDDDANPYEVIPVFHFKVNRRKTQGDLGPSILSEQDAINKLFSDMMVSAEFSQMIQRVILTNSTVGDLPNGAGINWTIPDIEAKVLELGGKADSLDSFIKAMEKITNSIAAQSKTPKHYFFAALGGSISGDALIAMEAPLNKKAGKRRDLFSPVWVEAGNFILKLMGIDELSEEEQLTAVWQRVESVQPKANAEIREINTRSGIPLVTSVRREGWSETEIQQLEKDQEAERKKNRALAGEALDRLRAESDSENADGETQVGKVE